MSEPTSVEQLRAWAAEVCGYTIDQGGYAWGANAHGYAYQQECEWQPDTNIAQAFEVLDAVAAKLPNVEWSIGCTDGWYWAKVGWKFAEDKTACMAILLAAREVLDRACK